MLYWRPTVQFSNGIFTTIGTHGFGWSARGEISDVRNRSYEPDIVRSGAKRCRPRIEGFLWRAKNNDCTRINSVRIDTRARHWDRNLHAFTTMKYNGARAGWAAILSRGEEERGRRNERRGKTNNQTEQWLSKPALFSMHRNFSKENFTIELREQKKG